MGTGITPFGRNRHWSNCYLYLFTGANGLFSTILGDGQYLPNIFLYSSNLWLEVTVDVNRNGNLEANEVFSPRQKLTGTAWESHRIEPLGDLGVNLIGGASSNGFIPGIWGATVCGGGSVLKPDWVRGGYGIVGGGWGNLAGACAAVVGGTSNSANGLCAFTGGGENNAASGLRTVVAGGRGNLASGDHAVVAGGSWNTASGGFAAVAGGINNSAKGIFSFAAGRDARADHDRSFVWNGDESFVASSTRPGQFFARAPGGMVVGDFPLIYESQLLVSCNGGGTKPQLYLWEAESGDFVRLRMANSTFEANYWDIATCGGVFNIYYQGGGSDVLSLTPNDATNLLMMRNGARLTAGGVWTNWSDRAAKTNFAAVDGRRILEQVAATPILTWNYKTEPESVRHMGPMAQDFYAAFALGDSDKSIGTVDAEGVALAAIQGLHQIISEQSAQIGELQAQRRAQEDQIAALRQQNTEMQGRLAALETAVARMAGSMPGPGR